MTTFKDIYPQNILDIINNENFNNIELDSPMIKPEVIAKALNISFDEKLTVEFDSASRSIKPNLYDDFLTNRRKNMWRIANVIVGTGVISSGLTTGLLEQSALRLTEELLMPEKLIKRLIQEKTGPHYIKIRYTNPKTGVEEIDIVETKLTDHDILVNVAELLQVSYKDLNRRLNYLEFINK